MNLSEITDPQAWAGMREEWNALVAESGNPLVFSRHEWLWAWWQTYGEGQPLHVICAREGDRLIGALALRASDFRVGGVLKCQVALPIGQGEASYQDALVACAYERKVISGMLAHLRAKHPEWEALVLRKLHSESVWPAVAREPGGAGAARVWRERGAVRYMKLPRSAPDLEAGLGRATRKHTRGDLRNLQQVGQVTVGRCEEVGEMLARWPRFQEIHEARWGRDELLKQGYEKYRVFVENLLREFAGAGVLRMTHVDLDGQMVAGLVSLAYAGVLYSFMMARDSAYADYGLGRILTLESMKYAVREGLARYDFGTGAEEYKALFGAYERELTGMAIPLAPGLRGRLVAWRESRER
jgi:CelD/BcsL family acetyltransferase involved in cellulose biosynthesis